MNVAHDGWVEKELDRLTKRHSCNGQQDPDEEHEAWRRSVRIFNRRLGAEMRRRWVEYHCHMATLHGQLTAEREAKAEGLCEEDRGEGIR